MLLIVVWALGVDDIIWKCPRGYMLKQSCTSYYDLLT